MTGLTRSYVHGTSDAPLSGATIGAVFDRAVQRRGDAEALIVPHQAIRWNYHQLDKRVDAFAAGLLAPGLAPDERVGIWSPNNAEWIITQFATTQAGGVICAAVEYRGGTGSMAFETIEDKIRPNTRAVLERAKAESIPVRQAAVDLAVERVRRAMGYRKTY